MRPPPGHGGGRHMRIRGRRLVRARVRSLLLPLRYYILVGDHKSEQAKVWRGIGLSAGLLGRGALPRFPILQLGRQRNRHQHIPHVGKRRRYKVQNRLPRAGFRTGAIHLRQHRVADIPQRETDLSHQQKVSVERMGAIRAAHGRAQMFRREKEPNDSGLPRGYTQATTTAIVTYSGQACQLFAVAGGGK